MSTFNSTIHRIINEKVLNNNTSLTLVESCIRVSLVYVIFLIPTIRIEKYAAVSRRNGNLKRDLSFTKTSQSSPFIELRSIDERIMSLDSVWCFFMKIIRCLLINEKLFFAHIKYIIIIR